MVKIKLDEIKHIKYATTEQEVNDNLLKGYQIVRMYQTRIKTFETEQTYPLVVMGSTTKPKVE